MMGNIAVVDGYGMLGAALGVRDIDVEFISEHARERIRRAVFLTTKLHLPGDSWCAFLLLHFVSSARIRPTLQVTSHTRIRELVQMVGLYKWWMI